MDNAQIIKKNESYSLGKSRGDNIHKNSNKVRFAMYA